MNIQNYVTQGGKIPLFDIDDTLLKDVNTAYSKGFTIACEQIFAITAYKNEIDTSGKVDNQIFIEVLTKHNLSEQEIEQKLPQLTQAMSDYFIQHAHEGEYIVLPGAKKLLELLHSMSVPVGVLTGNTEAVGWERLNQAGLKDYVDFGSFGNLVLKRAKLVAIAKERAEKVYHLEHISLQSFIIIGDTPADIACAKEQENNISVIALPTGKYSAEELQKAGADIVIGSLTEQKKIFDFLGIKTDY